MTTEITSGQEPAARLADAVTDEQLIAMLVDRARGDGLKLTGEGGLLQQLTKPSRGMTYGQRFRLAAGLAAAPRRQHIDRHRLRHRQPPQQHPQWDDASTVAGQRVQRNTRHTLA
ncbi:hypothetical protein AB0M35_26700 [Micromonospora sp. NPDC051196]|uniref:hypothetical protein n=1 Tax=Micromonospora sp. NPDC051196 TaxID=3155281 RepID=UPI003413F361